MTFKRNIYYSFFLFLILPFFSCRFQKKSGEKHDVQYDTIQISNLNDSIKQIHRCSELFENFYFRFGIIIQEYFDIRDSLAIDLNSDGFIDTLAVLSPISIEDYRFSDCTLERFEERTMVEIINDNGKSKVRRIHTNLISNIEGVLSKYNGISLTQNGFEIQHYSGSRFSWAYSTEFSTKSTDSITLLRTKKVCSFEGNEKSEEYFFNEYSSENINIMDTIYNNCGCNSIWDELEKKYNPD